MRLNKSGHLDNRYRMSKEIGSVKDYCRENSGSLIAVILLGWLAGVVLAVTIYRARHPQKASSEPTGQTIEPVVVKEARAEEPLRWNDAIRQIFPADEAGRMIRICIAENKSQSKYATNYNRNGTYDYSYCQINSVHKPKGMSDSEWKTYLEDPINHAKEVRRIFLSQGWWAWTVARWVK